MGARRLSWRHGRKLQRGATLAELMVALAVGLAVLLLGAALLVSANGAWRSQTDAAAVDEGGRQALDIIARAVRQAGFVNWDRDDAGTGPDPLAPARIGGLDNHTLNRSSDAMSDPGPDAVNGSDVLALRFVGAGPSPDGDGSVISCAGFGVGELQEGWSIFYVALNAEGVAELRCKYRGATSWGSDAIVAGVDSFQVLYGLDSDEPPDGVANRYVSASVLDSLDAALAPAGADAPAREREQRLRTHWKRVTTIRVALLLHGARHGDGAREPAVYDLFGGAYGDAFGAGDRGTRVLELQLPAALRGRERKLFSSTILLRNRPL